MSTNVTFNNAHKILLASDFFMARRPILNHQDQLVAYELLFCSTAENVEKHMLEGACDIVNTASVIADISNYGLNNVIGDGPAYISLDTNALMSDIFRLLPPARIILAIASSVTATDEILGRLTTLVQAGFRVALDLYADSEDMHKILPLVETIKIDVYGKNREELNRLGNQFRGKGKKLLAENVETMECFKDCMDAGFHEFQGYYFTRPDMLVDKKLSPSHAALLDLMALIASDAENADIEASVKSDIALGLNLLRLVNTPAISPHRIESLRQALMVVGRKQLQRWLHIMLYAASDGPVKKLSPLLILATTRARLLELIVQKSRPTNRGLADTAFTVGIMSLMDTLFGIPMEELLLQLIVVNEVSDALLYRKGYFGELLQLVEYTEWARKTDTRLLQALEHQRLSCSELYRLQLAAFEWNDHVIRGLHNH